MKRVAQFIVLQEGLDIRLMLDVGIVFALSHESNESQWTEELQCLYDIKYYHCIIAM